MSNELLLKAADLIEAKGWWKKDAVKTDKQNCFGSVCAVDAIRVAASHDDKKVTKLARAVVSRLKLPVVTTPIRAVIDWNDAPERTVDEVVAALRVV